MKGSLGCARDSSFDFAPFGSPQGKQDRLCGSCFAHARKAAQLRLRSLRVRSGQAGHVRYAQCKQAGRIRYAQREQAGAGRAR